VFGDGVAANASEDTRDSYAYAFQLLLTFASKRLEVAPSQLAVEQIDAPLAGHAPGTKIYLHRARYFPLGLPTLDARDHVVRRVNSVSRFTRSSRLSNRTSPCSKRSIRGIRLHKLLRKSRATDHFNWRDGVPREHRSKTDGSEHAAR
jgi:hypothetical protein